MTPERVRLGERYEQLRQLRGGIEETLRDIQRLVRPNDTSFITQHKSFSAQEEGSKYIFDDTAVWANSMFANGLSGYLIPKAQRWAYLKPMGRPSADLSEDELIYLEQLSDQINHEFSIPRSNFYTSLHESFFDLGSYGTSCVYVDIASRPVRFRSYPLADCFFDTNEDDEVDTVYFRRHLRTKALLQMFPDVAKMDGFKVDEYTRTYTLIYAVEPNMGARGGRIGSQRPWKSTYFVEELKDVVKQGFISYFPFLVPRWAKISGEVMGRSPAMTCLSHIRLINKMVKELIKSAEISNAPPLWAEEDSLLLPINYGSRQILFGEPGSQIPQPIVSGSQPQLSLELLTSYKESITKCFFVDQIIREQKKERQTILELQDERGQMLQQLSPLLGRMENELLSPAIELTFDALARRKELPPIPDSLMGGGLEIVYTSPAAHAQYASSIGNISGFLQDITPLMQNFPQMADSLDDNALLDNYSRMRNIPRDIIRSKADVNAIREQRAQAEQQQQALAAAPQVSSSIKDIAQARATDPEGAALLGI